jgi:hypothetical protein
MQKQRHLRPGDRLDARTTLLARGGTLDEDELRVDAERYHAIYDESCAVMNDLDLKADLNAQDDDGLGWSTLDDARDPALVRPGSMLLAGNAQAQAVVRVVGVDDDGQVHFSILPGSVGKNRHLLDRTVA